MRTSTFATSKKPIAQCTRKEIELMFYAAKKMAGRRKRPDLAEDFASYVAEDVTKQGTLYYNLNWLWATFMRNEAGGNLRSKVGNAKAQARQNPLSIEHENHEPTIADPKPLASDVLDDPIRRLAKKFHGRERAIVILYFKWEFTYKEIAEVYGVSGQMIQQNFQALLHKAQLNGWVVPTKRNI